MRLASPGARIAALIAAPLFASTCRIGDALQPAATKDISLTYAGDTVLVVAAPVTPAIAVTVDGAPLADARLRLTSSDTAVVAVHGDTLLPRERGGATLTIALVSSALPSAPPSVTRALVVVADTVTLDSAAVHFASLGDTVTLVATGRDARGAAIAGATVAFASSDTGVVAVSAGGRVTARANGTATLRAVLDRDTAAAEVTVQQALTRWTFSPASLRLDALTATDTVVATGHDARGNGIAGLAPGAWTVGDAAILTLAGPGRVTAKRNGATFLYATLGAVRDSVSVSVAQRAVQVSVTPDPAPAVTSLGDAVQLTGRAFDRQAVELQGAQLSWFTLDPGVVRVTGDGLVTALATGSARVVASLDAGADTATVTISNDPATLAVLPDSAHATSVGDTLLFRAVARNARGDSVAATVAWQTPDTAFVELLPDGRVIAESIGVARIIAQVGARTDTALARVSNVPTRIEIGPATRTYVSLGDVDTLPVTITNARDGQLPRGSVTWTTDDAAIARVSTAGVVTAKDTGQTVIRATSGFVYDSVVVSVQNLPASLAFLSPRTADTLTAIGQSLTLEADVRNARGDQILGYPIRWHSTNRLVADTILPTGRAMAIGWGATSLVAEAGTAADTMVLVVLNPTRLYVNNGVVITLRVGTPSRPFARIQDAVNAADAGDTVVVMRGSGPYSEAVALARRITILGDSTAFIQGGRNPSDLPLLAHDTGAAAITAYTTAPVSVRYLTIRHTLDGPAFAGDGSDAQLEWLYVNPPSMVTSRIGRGISIQNSSSGSILRHVNVRMVRGYGISLVNSSSALVTRDTVIGVDSIGVSEGGAGISLRGGAFNTVSNNVIRATRGPRILVRGPASADIFDHAFSGRHPLVQVDSVTGVVHIYGNTFQLGWDSYDYTESPDCPTDTRCAGVLITDSRNGALVSGTPGDVWSYTSPVEIQGNTFYTASQGSGEGYGIRVRRSQAYGYGNTFRHIYVAHQLEGSSKGIFNGSTVDTTEWASYLLDADTLVFSSVVSHEAGMVYKSTQAPVGAPVVVTLMSRFSRRSGNLINVMDDQMYASLQQSAFTSAPNAQPITFWGHTLYLYRDTVSASGDTVPYGYRAGSSYTGAVAALFTTNVWFSNSLVQGYTAFPGVLFYAGSPSASFQETTLTGNRVGLYVDATVPTTSQFYTGGWGAGVFDNLVAGIEDRRASSSGAFASWWWGDGRGPRGWGNPAATGDSLVAPQAAYNPLAAAPDSLLGGSASALRHVRGTGQTAVAGATLANALTVRVVDAAGLPVVGASVTFTVTGGGGNLAGLGSVTLTSNADGLAETPFTLGPAAGANTVSAAASGLNALVFTATGT